MKHFILCVSLALSYLGFSQDVQWASKVVYAHSGLSEKQFSADQVLGEPDVYPLAGIYPTSWISIHPHSRKNIIHVGYEKPQLVSRIIVAETYNPGSIKEVFIIDEQGKEFSAQKMEPKPISEKSRLLYIDIPKTIFKIKEVKLILDSKMVPEYNAIDAIGICAERTDVSFKPKVYPIIDKDVRAIKLDTNINSHSSEIKPLISPDGLTMYFSRSHHAKNIGGVEDPEDIWYSEMDLETWQWGYAKNIGTSLNNNGPNFISAISEDERGNTMLLLGNVYSKDAKHVSGGISITKLNDDGTWTSPEKVIIENYYNDGDVEHYFLGPANKVLIMALERKDSYGGNDLYISIKDDSTGHYKTPVNLGKVINTAGDEADPFMPMDDDMTLYFSTDGRRGYGEKDIYITKRLDDSWTKWSEPQNLGPGINSEFDDYFFSQSPGAEYSYFCRNDTSAKNLDIYSLNIPEYVVGPVVDVSGILSNEETNAAHTGAMVTFTSSEGKNYSTVSTDNGGYHLRLPYGFKYNYKIKTDDGTVKSGTLDLTNVHEYEKRKIDFKFKSNPNVVAYNGLIKDSKTSSPIAGAKVSFFNLSDKEIQNEVISTTEGTFNNKLPYGANYIYTAFFPNGLEVKDTLKIKDVKAPETRNLVIVGDAGGMLEDVNSKNNIHVTGFLRMKSTNAAIENAKVVFKDNATHQVVEIIVSHEEGVYDVYLPRNTKYHYTVYLPQGTMFVGDMDLMKVPATIPRRFDILVGSGTVASDLKTITLNVNGRLVDNVSNKNIPSAKIVFVNMDSGLQLPEVKTSSEGKFLLKLTNDSQYKFVVYLEDGSQVTQTVDLTHATQESVNDLVLRITAPLPLVDKLIPVGSMLTVKGDLLEKPSNAIYPESKLEFKNLSNGRTEKETYSSTKGSYVTQLIAGSKYEYVVHLSNGGKYCDVMDLTKVTSLEVVKNITIDKSAGSFMKLSQDLSKVKEPAAYVYDAHKAKVLKNVVFGFGETCLRKEFTDFLFELANQLKSEPNTKIFIAGHTDNVGSDVSNLILSKKRALVVRNYLLSLGVPESSLLFYGYGESKPKATNQTPDGRNKNRRVEIIKL